MIHSAGLAVPIVDRALDMFDRVARAEAKIHGTTVDEVAFHEVGAIDSIVDIVGTAAALAWLQPSSVSVASVAVGHGNVTCAHGIMPVPAPATVEILSRAGGIMESGGIARELCTPTGAAILASAVTEWSPMPALVPMAVGYGAGDADLADRANVLRVLAGRRKEPSGVGLETVARIEANIDDMSPEMCEHAASCAFDAGALDVWWTPIVMKKNRPALLLSVLAPDSAVGPVMDVVLRETTTIGVRFDQMTRRVLDRETVTADTAYGQIPLKVARSGCTVINVAPEYESCRDAAIRHNAPLKRVFAAVLAAYEHSSGD
ncbi:MAG: nickel pincer cofactor biosynthesis protein LarC [Proteobacteria bacterium]|nr:nickel pincer cofactor biosynthesis protein LarC [Pseudomonadota bacterium]